MKKGTAVKLLLVVVFAVLVVWTGTRGSDDTEAAKSQEKVKIGILQTSENEALDFGREGFLKGLEDLGYVEGE